MEIILKEDIDKLGQRGQVVKVKAGFGRNYLLPRGLAVEITPGRLRQVEHEKRAMEAKTRKEKTAAREGREKLESLTVTVARKTGEGDALYGSVTNADVAQALAARGISVDKRKIQLDEPIKSLGSYDVPVRLHREVTAMVKVIVVKEG